MAEIPGEIRDRTPAPHALRVGLRRLELPIPAEVAAFSVDPAASVEEDSSWIRVSWGADRLLILLEEGKGPEHLGFDHALRVESSFSKACFLAAYFIARRCGGVVQIRQRATVLAAGAFAERYLDGEDLEARWDRATART
jgi:hypothetical protein